MEPRGDFYIQFETKQETYNIGNWIHGKKVTMGDYEVGTRLLDVKWSFLEIDMNQVEDSVTGRMADPGTARGCKYGDKFWITPDSSWSTTAWSTGAVMDRRGDPGLPTDGVRRVFPNDPKCWKYDQSKGATGAYNHYVNKEMKNPSEFPI